MAVKILRYKFSFFLVSFRVRSSLIITGPRGSSYRAYIFKESIRCYAIDYKGQGRKEVIYLHVADISCTQGICKSTGLSYRGPYGGVP